MIKEEILKQAKPILFNTKMVQAIIEGRKTVTRRVVKQKYSDTELRIVGTGIRYFGSKMVHKGSGPT